MNYEDDYYYRYDYYDEAKVLCDGSGEIDFPHKYNRDGPPENWDLPGDWVEYCPGCENCEESQ